MSNKKTLLNEGTIRRFMKLANMDNLAESYLDRFEVNEEEVEEGMGKPRKKDEEDLEEEMDVEMDAEVDDEPMDAPADEGGADEAMVKRLVDAIAGAIEQETGVEVAVEDGAVEADMGGMDDESMGAEEDEEEVDLGGEMEMDDEAAKMDVMEDDNFDAYIAEVTRRVAKRIIKSKISK